MTAPFDKNVPTQNKVAPMKSRKRISFIFSEAQTSLFLRAGGELH